MRMLKRHRIAQGLSLTALAKIVKVHVSTAQAWECGRNLPRPKHVPVLARALQVDPMELTQLISPDPLPRSSVSPQPVLQSA